tara:strand:+ start:364 stop:783 length:420 start_codon:yes stop_codon:yes gene_type:complete
MNKIERVKKVVCFVTKMSEKELLSRSRKRHIVDNRRMAFAICKDILELKWTEIANAFKLNHASIIHHYKKHKELIEFDNYYGHKYHDLLEFFKLQIDYVEPRELIREIVNIKKKRYNDYLKQKLRENEGKGQSETTFIG